MEGWAIVWDGNRMRGSRRNEVEANEERSSHAGDGMQKGTREYIRNEKEKRIQRGTRERMRGSWGASRFLEVTSAVVVATLLTVDRLRLSAQDS